MAQFAYQTRTNQLHLTYQIDKLRNRKSPRKRVFLFPILASQQVILCPVHDWAVIGHSNFATSANTTARPSSAVGCTFRGARPPTRAPHRQHDARRKPQRFGAPELQTFAESENRTCPFPANVKTIPRQWHALPCVHRSNAARPPDAFPPHNRMAWSSSAQNSS